MSNVEKETAAAGYPILFDARLPACDFFITATDADAVVLDWGKFTQRRSAAQVQKPCASIVFPPARWIPKVDAVCQFAEMMGKKAATGALKDLQSILRGEAADTEWSVWPGRLLCFGTDLQFAAVQERGKYRGGMKWLKISMIMQSP